MLPSRIGSSLPLRETVRAALPRGARGGVSVPFPLGPAPLDGPQPVTSASLPPTSSFPSPSMYSSLLATLLLLPLALGESLSTVERTTLGEAGEVRADPSHRPLHRLDLPSSLFSGWNPLPRLLRTYIRLWKRVHDRGACPEPQRARTSSTRGGRARHELTDSRADLSCLSLPPFSLAHHLSVIEPAMDRRGDQHPQLECRRAHEPQLAAIV